MKPRLYISGPYTAATPRKTDENIDCARSRMIEAMLSGWWPRCPHTHTARMERDVPEISWGEWLELDLDDLSTCDAIWAVCPVPEYRFSPGVCLELAWAHLAGMPIYTEFDMDRDARYFRGQYLPGPQMIQFEQLSNPCQKHRQSPLMSSNIRESIDLAGIEVLRIAEEGRIPDPMQYRGSRIKSSDRRRGD